MLSKRYESTEVERRTWLHVPSGTLWSTSSDTHQVEQTFEHCDAENVQAAAIWLLDISASTLN